MEKNNAASPVGMRHLPRRQILTTFIAVMFANFLGSLDQTIVGTAMPRIITDLGGFSHYTWLTTIYIVTSGATMPVVGKLTDMYGRKPFFVAGLIIFIVSSALCGISNSMAEIIIFRGIQGIGGGIILVTSFTVIGDLFSPIEFGKYQGYMSISFGLSSIIGPTLGGYITDTFTWHWIFFINVPLGILIILIFIKYFPNIKPDNLSHKVDYPGLLAMVFTVVPFMLALSWGGVEYAWNSPVIIGMFVFCAIMLCVFIVIESRSLEPILPLSLFRNSIASVSFGLTFLTGIGMFSPIIFVPLFYQGVLGATATTSGNFLIPMMLSSILGSLFSGNLLSRMGGHYKIQAIIGVLFMAAGCFLLSRISVDTSYGMIVIYIMLQGFGVGIQLPLLTVTVQNAVPYKMLGVATSSVNFFRSIGGAVGLAVLGSIMNNSFMHNFMNILPGSVKSSVSSEALEALVHNPQALVSAGARQQLSSIVSQTGAQAEAVVNQLLETLRVALSSSLAEVFLISFFILLAALVLVFFLKEIPLRRQHLTEEEMSEGNR